MRLRERLGLLPIGGERRELRSLAGVEGLSLEATKLVAVVARRLLKLVEVSASRE